MIKFHVAVVQRWQRNVKKRVMHVRSCFCRFRCRRRCRCQSFLLLRFQKFWYQGNVTSHFPSLLVVLLPQTSLRNLTRPSSLLGLSLYRQSHLSFLARHRVHSPSRILVYPREGWYDLRPKSPLHLEIFKFVITASSIMIHVIN